MRRFALPILVAASLVVAQAAIVLSWGGSSLASAPESEQPRGAVGAGGAGEEIAATLVDPSDPALDGSAGTALIASIAAVRALADASAEPASRSRERKEPEPDLPDYSYPVAWGTPISGAFGAPGPMWPGGHAGIDFNGETGDPIFAATDGRVTYAEFNHGGYGNLIMIMRKDGTQTRYAHLSEIFVNVGQRVDAGEVIGLMGNTGMSTGSHLHFEVRVGPVPTPVDPASLWTGSKPGIPGKPPKWACQKYGC